MDAANYLIYIAANEQNSQLMARIFLNTFGHEASYPVDVSELLELSPLNVGVVRGLLSWAEANRDFRYGSVFLMHFKFIADHSFAATAGPPLGCEVLR
ncbi:hypothetical protein XAP6984_250038 [Xanthomonas phaseoli pv. phaseoli]|uniref:BACK domain-containing protein n=1 Tax=Xanthomonas campestris pv. phaseoli TaxID=317013 RepID=A0ABY1TP83_XANCH|nr:hypothetical protein XAP6984_250038 [Xanthomonas phaseoli pv. phaseoli]